MRTQKDSVLVHLDCGANYIGIRTYNRDHRGRGRFLFSEQMIRQILSEPAGKLHLDKDCGAYAEIWREEETIKITFAWLSISENSILIGFKQDVTIPTFVLRDLLRNGKPRKILSKTPTRYTKIDATHAIRTLRHILPDKLKRRAFSKAMRDCFQWYGDEVTLSPDGGDNFFFTTRSGFPKCGGLILHEGTRNGYPCFYYSVHT